jgi:hypothetical protein
MRSSTHDTNLAMSPWCPMIFLKLDLCVHTMRTTRQWAVSYLIVGLISPFLLLLRLRHFGSEAPICFASKLACSSSRCLDLQRASGPLCVQGLCTCV